MCEREFTKRVHTCTHVCEFHCVTLCVGLVCDYEPCVCEQIVVYVVPVCRCVRAGVSVCVYMHVSLYVDESVECLFCDCESLMREQICINVCKLCEFVDGGVRGCVGL